MIQRSQLRVYTCALEDISYLALEKVLKKSLHGKKELGREQDLVAGAVEVPPLLSPFFSTAGISVWSASPLGLSGTVCACGR